MKLRYPITDRQKEMLALLNKRVTFLPGSFDKRFVRDLKSVQELTQGQGEYLDKVFHRYRRQIEDHERLCAFCEEVKEFQLVMEL